MIKVKTHEREALFKNDKLLHGRLKVLQDTAAILSKVTFTYSQSLKTGINGFDENMDNLSWTENQWFQKTYMILNNHHLAIKMVNGAFAAYTKVLRKYAGFHYTYNKEY